MAPRQGVTCTRSCYKGAKLLPQANNVPISRTSIYVAAARALGARELDPAVRNPDYLAEILLGDPTTLNLDHPAVHALGLNYSDAMKESEVANLVRTMTVRTRFIDEALVRAVANGARQAVILGAGLDSRAYRYRDLLYGMRVFEVDRPMTQEFKRQRVNAALGGPPPNLVYVAIDFDNEDLADIMARNGYDCGQRTFFVLEGVTMYLPEEVLRTTLGFVAAQTPGSSIVFDFFYRPFVEMLVGINVANLPALERPAVQRFLDLTRHEPWMFGIPVGGEREFLGQFGLELREILAVRSEEASKRYLTRADGTEVGRQALVEDAGRAAQRMRAEITDPGRAAQTMSAESARQRHRLISCQLADAVVGRASLLGNASLSGSGTS